MHLVTRAQWGAKPSKYDLVYIASTRGVKVHYEGAPVPASLADHHDQCAVRMRAIQASHLANKTEGYSDIAYNFVVCPHGYIYEGRGLHKRTAANGNQSLNIAHYSVCGMVGDSGLTQPTDAQLGGIRDAIEHLQSQGGAGTEIKGHRDGYATACPGGPLYAWVQRGAPRPQDSTPTPAPKPPAPKPYAPPPFPVGLAPGKSRPSAKELQKALRKAKFLTISDRDLSDTYGPRTQAGVGKFFAAHPQFREKGKPHDVAIGPRGWAYLFTLAYGRK
ncbi:N-acetylmuramoyl-L-alanine amidase [Streptomyces sp. NBC_00873]|uniref:N-acetylmuramoyl-L-alanine amidase n=1 Tax=Streptomyces sp. NBC_00873 TaxID=2975852 RepID=UPI003863769C|nr:N-acetylmuramoyl-L-alanine amidase [Streptomyces sp. NBC_00873]